MGAGSRAQGGPAYDVGQMWVKFAEAIRTGSDDRARLRSRGAPPPNVGCDRARFRTGQRQKVVLWQLRQVHVKAQRLAGILNVHRWRVPEVPNVQSVG